MAAAPPLLILHCEHSFSRAPGMLRALRALDLHWWGNALEGGCGAPAGAPHLAFPHLLLLHKGFQAFYEGAQEEEAAEGAQGEAAAGGEEEGAQGEGSGRPAEGAQGEAGGRPTPGALGEAGRRPSPGAQEEAGGHSTAGAQAAEPRPPALAGGGGGFFRALGRVDPAAARANRAHLSPGGAYTRMYAEAHRGAFRSASAYSRMSFTRFEQAMLTRAAEIRSGGAEIRSGGAEARAESRSGGGAEVRAHRPHAPAGRSLRSERQHLARGAGEAQAREVLPGCSLPPLRSLECLSLGLTCPPSAVKARGASVGEEGE